MNQARSMKTENRKLKIAVSGGGTGGHIYPALSIARGLVEAADAEILYLGAGNSMEERLSGENGFRFRSFEARGLSRKSLRIIKDILINLRGVRQAKKALRDFSPDIAVGTGGFVSGVALKAAVKLGIPIIIHEQNAVPSLANKLLAKSARAVCITFNSSAEHFPAGTNIRLTGLPVRKEILSAQTDAAYDYFGIKPEGKILLVTGGSQGAKTLNDAMMESWEAFLEAGIRIIHLTGANKFAEADAARRAKGLSDHAGLILLPYLERMEYALAIADMVVSRAGASLLAEVTAKGLPMLLVPYPHAAANHQEYNARELADRGAAVMINDKDLNGNILLEAVLPILQDDGKLKGLAAGALAAANPEALNDIVKIILDNTKA